MANHVTIIFKILIYVELNHLSPHLPGWHVVGLAQYLDSKEKEKAYGLGTQTFVALHTSILLCFTTIWHNDYIDLNCL